MEKLDKIGLRIKKVFDGKDQCREKALVLSRQVIRLSSEIIKMTHRGKFPEAFGILKKSRKTLKDAQESLKIYSDIYYAGFLQAAEKEYAEASIFFSIIKKKNLPTPETLKIGESSYLCGMGEAIGEMRRYILDSIRKDKLTDCERSLDLMDELYYFLFSFDYPEPLVRGLRRTVDNARGIIERTRADVTNSVRQKRLEEKL
ncbi:MAG: hypothetical protein CO162_00830 [bacterium (Candidatus Ratteibacteria) CG_4_9_14_3_um_filter_41_21]|uniref:Haloacid dehalogenase n=2 Tax=Candidatus Ratteibacteria TaxID=2979319 RepID=A0A2M7YHN9_9BACT|nr:MAG: hypothetical protein COW28_01785 [bacterium (Candidatus Ratteibacteria) CG15_BIG_FIL_POST_REV_8_21_14_020_41_12]PIW73799.1 MAG: hypothetical protein CO004_04020 [bacterium (Candidatus Ratteibacteria) CG_4_8_14_3_um_filter_41_36]PJA62480.1 MAG: hypothetical protein CO162_00830 [bacterium (Candidatus Ratteibacteria) CG_4_9_14_3_um_filter_41_21]